MDTVSMQVLERLSFSLLSAEYPSDAAAPPNPRVFRNNLRVFRRKVELSFVVLNIIQEDAKNTLTGGKLSPITRKKGKPAANNRRIDPFPFHSMGITVPTTDVEVRGLYLRILSQLRGILEVCGFRAGVPYVELNSSRTISSFSEIRCSHRFSNPHTPRRDYQWNKCLPQQWKMRPSSQISLKTCSFLWLNR